jgi:hypothetical protein
MYGPLILHVLLVTGTIRARMHLRLLYYKFIQKSPFLANSGVTECLNLYCKGCKSTLSNQTSKKLWTRGIEFPFYQQLCASVADTGGRVV